MSKHFKSIEFVFYTAKLSALEASFGMLNKKRKRKEFSVRVKQSYRLRNLSECDLLREGVQDQLEVTVTSLKSFR